MRICLTRKDAGSSSTTTPQWDGAEIQTRYLCVSRLLFGVDMPYDVVGKANHFVSCSLGHLGEALRFGLVLERVTREVDT